MKMTTTDEAVHDKLYERTWCLNCKLQTAISALSVQCSTIGNTKVVQPPQQLS